MSHSDPVCIVGAARTPLGAFQGVFADVAAPVLGAAAIKGALQAAKISPGDVDEVLMGCVLPAGLGQAPARQATIAAGCPDYVRASTVNKVCGSGMKTVMMAYDMIVAGSANVVVAGGMENMSRAPYLLDKARGGYRLGHGEIKDHMFFDGLEDAYHNHQLMGVFAEATAQKYQFTRAAQDAFATLSVERAKQAAQDGSFAAEITPVTITDRKGNETLIEFDESPQKIDPAKIPNLKPAFDKNGTVTAATSSSISDGAAALVLMRLSEAESRGLTPWAVIKSHAGFAHEPAWFTTAPVGAMEKVLQQAGWQKNDVDLFEINEAFAVVTMAAMHDMGLSHEQVNIHGGACALGHPIGATGARILVTLIGALQKHQMKKGVASLCIGGGEATALALELC